MLSYGMMLIYQSKQIQSTMMFMFDKKDLKRPGELPHTWHDS